MALRRFVLIATPLAMTFCATAALARDKDATPANHPQTAQKDSTPKPDAVPSHAETGAPTKSPQASGTSAAVLDVDAVAGVIGKSVKSYTGEDMGRVVDILVTPTGQVRAAVIDFGGVLGVGSRKVAVGWKTLNFANDPKDGPAVLSLTRDQVRVAPEYKAGDAVVILEAGKPDESRGAPTKAPEPAVAKPASPRPSTK